MMPAIDETWTLAPGRHAALLDSLARASAEPSEAFCAAGALSLARASVRDRVQALRPFAEQVALGLDAHGFATRVEELVNALEDDPPEDGLGDGSWRRQAEALLDERHRIELLLEGLSLVGIERDALGEERLAALVTADHELEAQLWRLTALNQYRERRLEEIAPERRSALWWYARGAHLPASAVSHLGAVASVVACFPEAGAELEALRDAEGVLLGAIDEAAPRSAPQSTKVSSLVEFRMREARSAEAAALTEGEILAMSEGGKHRRSVVAGLGWALSAAAMLVAIGTGFAYKNSSEKANKEKAALLAQAESLKAEADQNVRRLEEQLKTSVSMNEAQKAALELQIAEAKVAATEAQSSVKSGGTARAARPAAKAASAKPRATRSKPACAAEDPMCAD